MSPADRKLRGSSDGLKQELRRGTLVLAVLSVLRVESYGAAVQESLEQAGIPIEAGALYPMLRRLESQGLLTSEWRLEDARKRRFYRVSADGLVTLETLMAELEHLAGSLRILKERSS